MKEELFMKNVLITPEGIKKNLKNIKPLDAICEYIWNGFDACATCVFVDLKKNQLGSIDEIIIKDNGCGINYKELKYKFQPFSDSKKYHQNTNHSLPHGKKGIGRLTFFSFAQKAIWNTVYEENGEKYEYYISMDKESLNRYDDNNGKKPCKVNKLTGTEVHFLELEKINEDEIINKIKEEFFWFLELNKENDYKIIVNNNCVDYSDLIRYTQTIDISNCKEKYDIRFVHWNQSLGNEYSRIYYIGSDNKERYKEPTKLNKRSDHFFHSVYVRSNYFNDFYFAIDDMVGQTNIFSNQYQIEYKNLISEILAFLTNYRREFLKKESDAYITKLVNENIYPEFDENNILSFYQKQELDNLVGTLYVAEPKIFTNLNNDNKKITLQLLKLIMDNGDKKELFKIFQSIINLDAEEQKELSELLEHTTLNNITKTIKLLCDRQEVVQALKEIVFNKEFKAREVEHVQELVEKHYWLFGEQYNLITAAEPDFELALKGKIKAETNKEENVSIDHPNKNKEMDIYMVRQDRHGKITENVVVELKRPTIKLGEKELSQVKRYMRVIKKEPRFNAGNVKWTFYLVGNDFSSNDYILGELESHKNFGEQHLVHSQDNGLTKIYVLKWSELFDDYSKRHNFLMEHLKLEEKLWLEKHKSADEAVASVKNNSATLSEALIPKKNNHK